MRRVGGPTIVFDLHRTLKGIIIILIIIIIIG
jgi:hypothetical protein